MSSVQQTKKPHQECASKYSMMMGLIYNVENSVEKIMKARDATLKYNNCIYFKQLQTENSNNNIIISLR